MSNPPQELPPKKSTLHESLSALMDGELEELDLHRLLKALPDHPDARAKWSRYQLVSSILQREAFEPVSACDFADAVQSAINESHVLTGDKSPGLKPLHRPFTKFAVAASVALMVVGVAQWQQYHSPESRSVVVKAPTANAISDPGAVSPLLIVRPEAVLSSAKSKYQQDLFVQYGTDRTLMDANRNIVPLAPVAVKVDENH